MRLNDSKDSWNILSSWDSTIYSTILARLSSILFLTRQARTSISVERVHSKSDSAGVWSSLDGLCTSWMWATLWLPARGASTSRPSHYRHLLFILCFRLRREGSLETWCWRLFVLRFMPPHPPCCSVPSRLSYFVTWGWVRGEKWRFCFINASKVLFVCKAWLMSLQALSLAARAVWPSHVVFFEARNSCNNSYVSPVMISAPFIKSKYFS